VVRGIAVGADGEILLWGWAEAEVDLDPGPGTQMVNGSASVSVSFYAAYSKDGALLWHRTPGVAVEAAAPWGAGFLLAFALAEGWRLDLGNGIVFAQRGGFLAALSKAGLPSEVLAISGQWNALSLETAGNSAWAFSTFQGQIRLGTNGPSRTSSSGTDYLLLKLDLNTGLAWASVLDVLDGDQNWGGQAITPLPSGRVFLAHPTWFASVDIDPGPGSKVVGAVGSESAFVAAYGNDGSLEYGGELRGNGLVQPKVVRFDDALGIVLAGEVYGDPGQAWVDVDISSAERRITGVEHYDIWIARYDSTGGLSDAARLASQGEYRVHGISMSPRGFRVFSEFNGAAVLDDGAAMSQLSSASGSSLMVEVSPSLKLISSFQLVGVSGPVTSTPGGFVIRTVSRAPGMTGSTISRYGQAP
jgi:hypothetical protein